MRMLRLWGIMRQGNTGVFSPQMQNTLARIARTTIAVTPGEAVLRGIFAGWLIAMLVWMRAAIDNGQIALIVIVTYFVGAFVNHAQFMAGGPVRKAEQPAFAGAEQAYSAPIGRPRMNSAKRCRRLILCLGAVSSDSISVISIPICKVPSGFCI